MNMKRLSGPQQASGSGPVAVSVEEAGSRAVKTKQDSSAEGPDNDSRGAPIAEYSMGYDAGLEVAAHLLTSGALRKDVTLAELADHLRMMKIEREQSSTDSISKEKP